MLKSGVWSIGGITFSVLIEQFLWQHEGYQLAGRINSVRALVWS